jgi:hypothetical protein
MIFKKLLDKLKSNNKERTIIPASDSFIKTSVVWNTYQHIIFLISYTEDYALDMCEFIEGCANTNGIKVKAMQSSYDEETDEQDKYGDPVYITHKRLYVVVGGHPNTFGRLSTNIANLANPIWDALVSEICNNCVYSEFIWLEEYAIFNKRDFRYTVSMPEYDEECVINKTNMDKNAPIIVYTDPEIILQRLPECFTGRSILHLISVDYYEFSTNAYDILSYVFYTHDYNVPQFTPDIIISELSSLYASILKVEVTMESLKSLLDPLFLHNEDGDTNAGFVPDYLLDETFNQTYERFSAVADDSTQYEDIDERIDGDEESENMRKEDMIEDDTY